MKVPKLKKYSTERMIRELGFFLARDFQTNLQDPSFCSSLQRNLVGGTIEEIRKSCPETDSIDDSYLFKCTFQMASLFKRFRFKKDLYSDQELSDKAIFSYHETQDRISKINFESLDAESSLILRLARIYISHVLGEYCDDECRERARFGRKASVGIPAARASEAERWEPSISGSSYQISWFDSEMSQNPLVGPYWTRRLESDPNRSIYQEVDMLALTLVPKTFKSLRSIMPNTTLGTYQSYGLGEMMRVRLRKAGYDIKTLQERHKYLAQLASTNNLYVTADLSSASDSISRELIRNLLPSDWFKVLDQSRIGKVKLPNGEIIQSETFCTMGIGYTFPLQTLVFLSLLKAIEAIHFGIGNKRLISVYGDDMIYSVRMHKNVLYHLGELGFVINKDKTFCDGPFRESCGGDYHHGVDVRPFQPRNGQSIVSEIAYEATLYKFANGLLRRWTEYELPETLDYICRELSSFTKIKIVPSDFPDDAGLKVILRSLPDFLARFPHSNPKAVGSGVFRFSYLRFEVNLRKETRHDPYYWLRLRGLSRELYFNYVHEHERVDTSLVQLIQVMTGADRDVPSPLFYPKTKKKVKAAHGVRSCLTGRRARRLESHVVIHNTGSYHRQSGTSLYEDR